MYKITLTIDGMACGMCEAHINEAIRGKFKVKKVTSSHTKGKIEIITPSEIDENELKRTIAATGYTVTDVSAEPYEKKKFSFFGK